MLKKLLIHTRRSVKIIILSMIAAFLIIGAIAFLYKPTYAVYIKGEQVGYTEDRGILQRKINDYIEKGDGSNTNVAFVQVEDLPEYKLCLLKKGIVTNDNEILNDIKSSGITYYRYYAITDNQEEKAYVSNFETAENIINELKDKNSSNVDDVAIVEKYETDEKNMDDQESVVSKLYQEAPKKVTTTNIKVADTSYAAKGQVNTAGTISAGSASLGGLQLAKPITGTITSRFGVRSNIRSSAHTGLDIAAPTGTPIKAAASGTVTFSGRKGAYGNMLVITHGNGVQTYYGHCSALYVSQGATVSQGQVIGAVGSTGNSTGPHLHLEIRVNGVAYNPQNYLY